MADLWQVLSTSRLRAARRTFCARLLNGSESGVIRRPKCSASTRQPTRLTAHGPCRRQGPRHEESPRGRAERLTIHIPSAGFEARNARLTLHWSTTLIERIGSRVALSRMLVAHGCRRSPMVQVSGPGPGPRVGPARPVLVEPPQRCPTRTPRRWSGQGGGAAPARKPDRPGSGGGWGCRPRRCIGRGPAGSGRAAWMDLPTGRGDRSLSSSTPGGRGVSRSTSRSLSDRPAVGGEPTAWNVVEQLERTGVALHAIHTVIDSDSRVEEQRSAR